MHPLRRRGRIHRGRIVQPLTHVLSLHLQDESHQQEQSMSYLQGTHHSTQLALKTIIIMPEFIPFQTCKAGLLPDKNFADIFFNTESGRTTFEKLTEFKCFIKVDGKPCKMDKKFPSVAFLKKHLKDDHNRYVCEICVEKKTCVLE